LAANKYSAAVTNAAATLNDVIVTGWGCLTISINI